MKTIIHTIKGLLIIVPLLAGLPLLAQYSRIQYLRPNDKDGLHLFETIKKDSVPFSGLKVKIGGGFTQDFQALRDQNNAASAVGANGVNANQLMKLTNGFNLAMANLDINVQLADGIRLNLTSYLSTRHHQDTWVKGGYIQFDKLPFLKNEIIDRLMDHFTLKVGDFEVDYGDQHYRRTDGGNSIYNPFVENYIMDEFATEIGGEIYYHSNTGLLVMGGISDGQLNPTVIAPSTTDKATGNTNFVAPAFHGKIGYDKQVNADFRFRLTGSFYTDRSSTGNTLYWGDRTGSHYFLVMENTAADPSNNAWSGRYNPLFSQQVNAFMINPFLKYKGLELFGTWETAKGRTINEAMMRHAGQYAADLIYRFPAGKENFWIGARYNSVTAALPGYTNDITINRLAGSAGWFLTKNVVMKAEYTDQQYLHFPATDIRSAGKFNGVMIEASVGF